MIYYKLKIGEFAVGIGNIIARLFSKPVEPARIGEAEITRAIQAVRASVSPNEQPKPPVVEKSQPPKEQDDKRNLAPTNDIGHSGYPSTKARYSIASYGHRREDAIDDSYHDITLNTMRSVAFGRELVSLVNAKCGGKASLCYSAAGISRQVYSRIISDTTSRVARRTAYQLCVGLALNRSEADAFLATAGYAFTPHDIESQAFAYCLQNGIYNLFDINEILVRLGCEPITIG